MRTLKPLHWALIGGLAYLLFAIVTLPAEFVLSRAARAGLGYTAASGSIWNGEAKGLRTERLMLGDGSWHLHPLALFTGRVSADVNVKAPQGYAEAALSASFGGQVTLRNFSASLPLSQLVGANALPGGWTGVAQARFSELVLENNWPVQAVGTLDLADLTGPTSQPANIGSYRLTFAAGSASAEALTGSVEDLDAAIDVAGTLKFARDRSYELNTLIAGNDRTPENIRKTMEYLGQPDAQGRRNFTASGTL